MRTISIRLDEATDAALSALCQREGLTQTDAIKAAIELFAERQRPTAAELAAELGLIGSFSGPSDLASNRAQYVKQRLLAKRERDATPLPARRRPHVAA